MDHAVPFQDEGEGEERKRLEGVEREAESACWGSERVGTLTRHRLQGDSVRVSPAPSCSFELYIRPATPPEPAYLPLVGTVSIAMGMEAQPARAWEDTAQPAQGPGPPPCTLPPPFHVENHPTEPDYTPSHPINVYMLYKGFTETKLFC